MRSNVKTIKLTTRLSLILAVITYLISIKGVLGLDEIKWLPDTFLFAVFGGAFAKDISKPIGVSEYRIINNLPEDLEKQLPSVEDIQNHLISVRQEYRQDIHGLI